MTAPRDTDRPRLGTHVRARRHLGPARAAIVLHDGRTGRAMQLDERAWSVVASMDGTRDLEGLRRAADARGVKVSPAHVRAFVGELGRLGLLDDGARDEAPPPDALPRDVPLAPLPGWRFTCDGRGACCRTFSTILFTPVEAAVARATLPDHHGGGHAPERLFTPERGLDETLLAGALEGGACAWLAPDGGCRLHAAGGPGAKPHGCRTFPVRFLDVGEAIRVAPRPECACVFAPSEEPPVEARRGGDLPAATFVPRLGTTPLGPDEASPEALLALLDRLPEPGPDGAAFLEGLADGLERDGLDAAPTLAPRPDEAAVEALRASAGRLATERAALPTEGDWVRRAAGWIAQAEPRPNDPPAEGERLYVRALLWAPPEDGGLIAALRRGATRIRIARAVPAERAADRMVGARVGVVEALARAYALD